MHLQRLALAVGFLQLLGFWNSCIAAEYDPLHLDVDLASVETIDATVRYLTRQRRIPVRVYLPTQVENTSAPVVLFSHGLGGSCKNNAYLVNHCA